MKWTKINEQDPPERDEFYLVTVGSIGGVYNDTWVQEAFFNANGIWKDPDYGQDRKQIIEGITHWAQMPEPANE